MSRFMGTTEESSKAGGTSPVPTNPPTRSSDASSSYWKAVIGQLEYTQDISQVCRTLQTPPSRGIFPPSDFSLTTSTSLLNAIPFSLAWGPSQSARLAALKRPGQAPDTTEAPLTTAHRDPKWHKPLETRPYELPIPYTVSRPTRNPMPYLRALMPVPSPLHSHCLAKDRLRLWSPIHRRADSASRPDISEVERQCIKDTMIHAWEEDACAAHGLGPPL